jgi:glutathione peroxidase
MRSTDVTHTFYEFSPELLDGTPQPLAEYQGKVALVVNTASECGFAPQLGGLQELWDGYRDQGLVVLGFPSNQFMGQEPLEGAEIGAFCQKNYGVTFPMFAKVDVNGDDAAPLYDWLRSEKKGLLGGKIKWNFTKFLISRDGKVIKRYAPSTKPAKIAADIKKALA